MNKRTIGIVGQGFVGSSIKTGFENQFNVETYDIIPEKSTTHSVEELAEKTRTIFVAVPTPMKKDGSCDTSIIENVLTDLNRVCEKHNVVIKSTIPPDKAERFEKKFSHLNLVGNPEFLTERNAVQDFLNQDRIILGGRLLGSVAEIYRERFPSVPIYKTDIKTAFMVKYATNAFLAVKLSLANEYYEICEKLNVDYNRMIMMAKLDNRLGDTFWNVPSHITGKRFWGGHCLPKDLKSLMFLSRQLNVEPFTMAGAWDTNLKQPEEDRDWEQMKGRAVSEDYKK